MQVATAVTFTVGAMQVLSDITLRVTDTNMYHFIQLFMWIFRLGIISTLLSEAFVNGFITGAAIHVLISQVSDLLGITTLPKQRGYFKLIKVLVALSTHIQDTNYAALTISVIAIIIMAIHNEFLKVSVFTIF